MKRLDSEESQNPDQLHYHYKRSERESLNTFPQYLRSQRQKSVFKRNKSLGIILIDIALITIILLLLKLYFQKDDNVMSAFGFEFQLEVFKADNDTIAVLQIAKKKDLIVSVETIAVQFIFGDQRQQGNLKLPAQVSQKTFCSIRFNPDEKASKVKAEFTFNKRTIRVEKGF